MLQIWPYTKQNMEDEIVLFVPTVLLLQLPIVLDIAYRECP